MINNRTDNNRTDNEPRYAPDSVASYKSFNSGLLESSKAPLLEELPLTSARDFRAARTTTTLDLTNSPATTFSGALMLAFAFVVLIGSGLSANSRLTISNPEFDFGLVPSNCDVSYRYWLHSTGSSDLRIEWTDASCPCAQLPLSTKIVKSGDSVALELIFTSGRVGGAITRKPFIKTNAGHEPERIEFKAKVIPGKAEQAEPLGIKPFRADLSSIGQYFQDTARIVLYNNSEQLMNMSMLYSRPRFFSVELPESIGAGESAICLVILNREFPEIIGAAFEKSFTIEAALRRVGDSSLKTRFTIPVRRKYSPKQ